MKASRAAAPQKQEHVLVIAGRGVALSERLSDLDRLGCRIDKLVQRSTEDDGAFRDRVQAEFTGEQAIHDRTLFVAGEPIGPRIHGLLRTIVSSMPNGTHLVLCAEKPGRPATLALSALALTVKEEASGVDISVEGQSADATGPQRAWRRRIDTVFHRLLQA